MNNIFIGITKITGDFHWEIKAEAIDKEEVSTIVDIAKNINDKLIKLPTN